MLPSIAAAHAGHDHELDALAQLAPEAVRGACIRTIDVPGQGPSCRDDDTWLVDVPGPNDIATHGPDTVAATDFAPAALDAPAQAAVDGASVADVTCDANSRVPRYKLIYAHPPGTYNQSKIDALKLEVYRASAFLNQQARSGRTAKLRVQCTTGAPSVYPVEVSAVPTFESISDAVVPNQRPAVALERYIVFYDGAVAGGYAGQGTWYRYQSASIDNPNNGDRAVAIQYAGVSGVPRWDVILHETLHTMGAVQDGAVDATGASHCTSDLDVMCYVDTAGKPLVIRCAALQVDCNRDSYFDASEPSTGFLATNWNVGHWRNRWLDHGAANRDVTPPSKPGTPVVDARTTTSIALSWPASLDDQPVVHYEIEYGPARDSTSTPTFSAGSLSPGTDYTFRIVAVDAAGNESASGPVTASTAPDTVDPDVPARPYVAGLTMRSVTVEWDAASDDVAVGSYRVYRRSSLGQSRALATTISAATRTVTLPTTAPGEAILVTVQAVDTSGNESALSPELTTRSLTDTTKPTAPTVTSAILSGATLQLAWTAATDDGGIGSYDIEVVDGATRTAVAQLGAHVLRYDVPGLPKPRDVDVYLTAVDLAGNRSLAIIVHVRFPAEPAAGGTSIQPVTSVEPSTTTPIKHGTSDTDDGSDDDAPGLRDTIAPTRASGLRITKRTKYGVAIAWRPSTDATGVARYRVLLAGARGRWVTHRTVPARAARGYVIPGLRPRRRYVVAIQALDAAGNVSARSSAVVVVTPRRRV